MFSEPMKPTRPSMTTILRWFLKSGRRHLPFSGWIGSIGCHSIAVCFSFLIMLR
jgi:hypothetical protein